MYKVPTGLAPAVFIPGLVFEALVRLRNGAYSLNLLRQRRLTCPVISIGNITMGGTGKTPLVIYVAGMLLNLGQTPAVLSRGYGRRSRELQVLTPEIAMQNPASELGDEPALIRRRIPDAWIGISKNRFEAGSLIERRKNGMAFILDDGFQHRKLFRDLDIVIVDPSQPLECNNIFPRGTLREPVSALRRCHIIIVNSAQDQAGRFEMWMRKLGVQAKVFQCEQKITAIIPFAEWQKSIKGATAGACVKTAFAVAALGNPLRFLSDLERIGIEVRGKKLLPDHYNPSRKDWIFCCEQARSRAVDAIVITEKDAIKISQPPDFPLMVAVQSTRIFDSGALENILSKCIGDRL
jgi:tetraacyldisaccharide 4'-kinase